MGIVHLFCFSRTADANLLMQVIRFRTQDPAPTHSVMTIGNFDGVHLGHQKLIGQVVQEARETGAQSVLVTFDPHPQAVLHNIILPGLSCMPQRLTQFEQQGLDVACVIPFTAELAKKGAEEFVREYLVEAFQVRRLIVGYDFAFGHNREGTAKVMEELSVKYNFSFEVCQAVADAGNVVSSTRIREALATGDFSLAERLMGRPFSVLGTVARGPQMGRQLGFPTVNVHPDCPLPLTHGVYASRVSWQGEAYTGVSNYGIKPTVGAQGALLETHLFDFDQEIYGDVVEVTPVQFLRPEKKFASLDELKAQIAKDSAEARGILER